MKRIVFLLTLGFFMTFIGCTVQPEDENGNGGGADTTAPVLNVTAPAGNISVLTNADFTITATATDASGTAIIAVNVTGAATFFKVIGTNTASFTTNFSGAGTYNFSISAYDNDINSSAPVVRTVTVTNAGSGSGSGYTGVGSGDSFEDWEAGTNVAPAGWINGATYGYSQGFATVDVEWNSAYVHEGDYSAKLNWTDGQAARFWTQMNSVSPGDALYVEAWIKKHADAINSPQGRIQISWYDSGSSYLSATDISGWGYLGDFSDWKEHKGVVVAPAGTAFALLIIEGSSFTGNAGIFVIDDYVFSKVRDIDSADPHVAVTSLTNNQDITAGIVPVSGNTSDDVQVKTVYAVISDGSTAVTNSGSPSGSGFTISVNAASLSAGSGTVTVWAEDYAGKTSASDSVTITIQSSSETVLFTESFETDGFGVRYTFNTTNFTDGYEDWFMSRMTNSMSGTGLDAPFTGGDGSWFVGLEDINGDAWGVDVISNQISNINVLGYSNLKVKMLAAANGDVAKFDQGQDFLDIYVKLDAGIWTQVGGFAGTGGYNTFMFEDTDLDGIGDGTQLTYAFQEFSFNVSGTGTNIQVMILGKGESGDEEIGWDFVRVTGE